MRETDRRGFDAITQAMPIYALRAYEGVVALIIDDYKNKRCLFPAAIMPQEQQEAILAQPGNRALAWIEILSNMSLALDSEDVFSADVLNRFVQAIIPDIEAGINPFSNKVAASVKDEDDDEDDDLDATMDDTHVNEAIRSLVKSAYGSTPVFVDETYQEPHTTMDRLVEHLRLMPESVNMVLQVCEIFQRQLAMYHKAQRTIRKSKRLEEIDKEMIETCCEATMIVAHTLYNFALTPNQPVLTPVAAVKYAVAILGTVDKFDTMHMVGRLRPCMMA